MFRSDGWIAYLLRMRIVLAVLFCIGLPFVAFAEESTATDCSAKAASKARQAMLKPYRSGDYEAAYTQLEAFRSRCASKLDPKTLGWVHSDLALAAGHAGRRGTCWELAWEAEGFAFEDEKLRTALLVNRTGACAADASTTVGGDHTVLATDCPRLLATFRAELADSQLHPEDWAAEAAAFKTWCAGKVGSAVSRPSIDCAAGRTREIAGDRPTSKDLLGHRCFEDFPALPGPVHALDTSRPAIPESEIPHAIAVPGHDRGWAFSKYVVLSKRSTLGDNGETIVVYKNGEGVEASLVGKRTTPVHVEITRPSTSFLALSRDFLFLDAGTGPDSRTLTIYDLEKKTVLHADLPYREIVRASVTPLLFYMSTDRTPTPELCPKLEEWKKAGLGAVVEEEVQLWVLSKSGDAPRGFGKLRCTSTQ